MDPLSGLARHHGDGRPSRGQACVPQDLTAPKDLRTPSFPLAKRSKAPHPAPLPSREDVVAFISGAQGKVGKREIAQEFNIKGGDRIWLKQMLKDLEIEGLVDRRGKTVHKAGQLPPVVLAGITPRAP